MKKLLLSFFIFSSFSVFAVENEYNDKLVKYVSDRLETRVENGSKALGLVEMISKDAKADLDVDVASMRCLGYPSPNENGKAVGLCLIKAFDRASGGDHLEVMYAVIIGEDIEHEGVSRNWSVKPQQYIYF